MLAAIVSSSDDAIISKDLNGIVKSWNQAAERIFGYTADEMIGRPITVLFPPDRLDEEARILARLQRGERVDHFETIRLHKSGSPLLISVTISPLRDANVVGASKVARDLTHAVEWEGEIQGDHYRRPTTRLSAKTSTASCKVGTRRPSGCSATRPTK